MTLFDSFRPRQRPGWVDAERVQELRWSFRQACIGVGVCQAVDGVIAGTSYRTPEVTNVDLGPPTRMTVRMLPGQLPAELAAAGRQLAPHLGAAMLRVKDRGHGWAIVQLLSRDPLGGTVPVPPPVASVHDPLTLGRGEDGRPVQLELAGAAHLICQGASGSGKSVGTYNLLGQLAAAQDVVVCGSDVTDILLSPWARRNPDDPWIATGTKDPMAHVAALETLVAEMDWRVGSMPFGTDKVEVSRSLPLVLVVIEETPALYRVLGTADKALERRAGTAIARLLAEGRKAGMRVLLITQRADADIIGGYERGQASHTFSFRIDNLAGLKMLHSDIPPDVAAEHATAQPGVALISAPGQALTRFKAPYLINEAYCRLVAPDAAA